MKTFKSFLILSFLLSSFICKAQWLTNGDNKLYTSNKVGIGTNTPREIFEINGSFVQSPNAFLYLGHIDTNDTRLRISTNSTYGAYVDYSHKLFIRKSDHTPIVTLAENGNIGIGTNTPREKIDLNGNLSQPPGQFLFLGYDEENNSRLRISTNSISGAYLDYSPDLYFRTGSEINVMTLKATGNVGIGVAYPNHKLEVAGTIRAQEIKIEATNWPDYVFSKDYQLPSLSEVSKHIKENSYLPGIPSAKEVEENGINLSEMNAKLLQKIEELTLYVIQQQEEILELRTAVKVIQRQANNQ